jgi:hypothetical protein
MKRSALAIVIAAVMLAGCSSSGSSGTSVAKSGASSSTTTTSAGNGGGSSADSSIPASAVIDDLVHGSDPKRYDLIAKCNEVAIVVLANSDGMNNSGTVQDSLGRLVAVVRPIDPAVADALAKDANAAAAWCKSTGMTNT